MQNCFTYNKQLHVQGSLQSMRPSPMLGAPLLITVNRDVPQTRTAKELYNCMPSNEYCITSIFQFFLYGAPLYAVSPYETESHGCTFIHYQSFPTGNQPFYFNCTFGP